MEEDLRVTTKNAAEIAKEWGFQDSKVRERERARERYTERETVGISTYLEIAYISRDYIHIERR